MVTNQPLSPVCFATDVDNDDDDDDEDARPVGRPSTGAVSLNIARTGRGQGRPKKQAVAEWNGEGDPPPKKRGRPALNKGGSGGGFSAYVPTGRPRGRPKANANANSEKAAASAEDNGEDVDDEEESQGEQKHSSPEKTAVTPKKRGRPSTGKTPNDGIPKRGRPPKVASNDDDDEEDSADQAETNNKKDDKEGSPKAGGLKWNSSEGENDPNDSVEYVSDAYQDGESGAA